LIEGEKCREKNRRITGQWEICKKKKESSLKDPPGMDDNLGLAELEKANWTYLTNTRSTKNW
jgi:hypothetical protein